MAGYNPIHKLSIDLDPLSCWARFIKITPDPGWLAEYQLIYILKKNTVFPIVKKEYNENQKLITGLVKAPIRSEIILRKKLHSNIDLRFLVDKCREIEVVYRQKK